MVLGFSSLPAVPQPNHADRNKLGIWGKSKCFSACLKKVPLASGQRGPVRCCSLPDTSAPELNLETWAHLYLAPSLHSRCCSQHLGRDTSKRTEETARRVKVAPRETAQDMWVCLCEERILYLMNKWIATAAEGAVPQYLHTNSLSKPLVITVMTPELSWLPNCCDCINLRRERQRRMSQYMLYRKEILICRKQTNKENHKAGVKQMVS